MAVVAVRCRSHSPFHLDSCMLLPEFKGIRTTKHIQGLGFDRETGNVILALINVSLFAA